MIPRVLKACWNPKGSLGLISGRRRKGLQVNDGDQCLMGARDSTCDHSPAIYVKDGLGEWALMQPPPPIPVDAVIDFDKLRKSIGANQAEVRRRMREPLNQKGKGIWFVDNVVPTYLRHVILTRLDAIANKPHKDFHPGTDHMVQDLIHPSLYSYIEGLSPIIDPIAFPKKKYSNHRFYYNNSPHESTIHSLEREFERQEEESKYQWLPSQFYVSSRGTVSIKSYINNLDETTNADLYTGIELMFELFLPMFENILPGKQLRGRELQVIVKAVNYVIQPKGHMYEGVWHVEGLAHEHIVASGLYYYSTSPCLKDGGLELRPYRRERELNPTPEGELIDEDLEYHVFENIPAYRNDARREARSNQSRLASLRRREWLRVRSMVGSVPTLENRLLVFPNNLQHKVSGIVNDSENEVGTRKTFMFFLVDPDVEIVSTRDVYEQQWDKLRPLQRATLNEVAQKLIGRSFPVEILDEIINRAKRGLTMAEARAHRLQLIKDRHMKFAYDNEDYS